MSCVLRSLCLIFSILLIGASASTKRAPVTEAEADQADRSAGYTSEGGVLLITSERASTLGDPGDSYELPFGVEDEPEVLAAEFMTRAAGEGAAFVSDLEIHLAAPDKDGKQLDCVALVKPVRTAERVTTSTPTAKPVEERHCTTHMTENALGAPHFQQDCSTQISWQHGMQSETHVEVGWEIEVSAFECGPLTRKIDGLKPHAVRGKVYKAD